MKIDLDEIRAFYERVNMPEEGIKVFCAGFEKINALGLADLFENAVRLDLDRTYGKPGDNAFLSMFTDLTGMDRRQVSTLFYTRCYMLLKEKYRARGYSEQMYEDVIREVRCKVLECHRNTGVWGDTVGGWVLRFLECTRFALGRFEYETNVFGKPMLPRDGFRFRFENVRGIGTYNVNQGDSVINIHIPSTGVSLTDEVRMDSYRKAREFYKYRFSGGVVPFICGSWLIYPGNDEFLPADMNIMKFRRDFHVFFAEDHADGFGECPRVFGKPNGTPLDGLPQETRLQRAITERVRSGKPTGEGFGIFLFDGERIYNRPVPVTDR